MTAVAASARAANARIDYLTGLHELATWLEQNPAQELPVSRVFNVPLTANTAVEKWAADNNMPDAVQYDEEGNASVSLHFGPVALHVYGYVDFAEHCDRNAGRRAREYAEKHGLALVEATNNPNDDVHAAEDPADSFGGLGSTWSDPAVRRAVRETIAESEADR